jgi:hypothetical protein
VVYGGTASLLQAYEIDALFLRRWFTGNCNGSFFWAGIGGDFRMLLHQYKEWDGGMAQGQVYAGGSVGLIGVSAEVSAGGGPTRVGSQGLGTLGLFINILNPDMGTGLDLGATYDFPMGNWTRPNWLGEWAFALRLGARIPLDSRP